MSDESPASAEATQGLNPALVLAIIGGFVIGVLILFKQLPTGHLSKKDVDRLLFYRYLREKGKLES